MKLTKKFFELDRGILIYDCNLDIPYNNFYELKLLNKEEWIGVQGDLYIIGDNFSFLFDKYFESLKLEQEVLGSEFEKVLNENMWDLYEK